MLGSFRLVDSPNACKTSNILSRLLFAKALD